ncbi:MAG: hypothetical protein GY835_02310 [bacterium]|nr:hypothetical protein [bacterium]
MRYGMLILMLAGLQALSCAETEPDVAFDYFGKTPPADVAEIFAPGFASTEHHDDMFPIISPDGREVILRINGKSAGTITSMLYLTRRDEAGVWSEPQPLPFLTPGRNGGANYAPDGSRLYFTTKRLLPGEEPAAKRSRIWSVDRLGDGWGEAKPIDTPINDFNLNGGCTIAADGTLYAAFKAPDREKHDIYELKPHNGGYPEYRLLPGAVNSAEMAVAPYVNSEEGYLLFTAVTQAGLRIKLSILDGDGNWTAPEVVDQLTSPEAKFVTMSPDGRYLFFVSHKRTDRSNPQATWTIAEFDEVAMENCADIYWLDAGFLRERISAWRAQSAAGD